MYKRQAMTRGQDSLAIGLEAPQVASVSLSTVGRMAKVQLIVIRATGEERAEHERVLRGIANESGGKCVWPPEEVVEVVT